MKRESLPDNIRGEPIETQVAVLYERVGNLKDDVRGLKNIILGGIVSGLLAVGGTAVSVAAGWLGPHTAVAAFWKWLVA